MRFGHKESDKFTILTHTELLNNKQREEALKRTSIAQIISSIEKKPAKKAKNKKFNNMPDIDLDDEFNI